MIELITVDLYILDMFRKNIVDFWYIEEQRFIFDNLDLKNKLERVIELGLEKMVFVFAEDFEEHLNYLLSSYYECKNELQFPKFEINRDERVVKILNE
jgi:hypothetical protein